LGERKEGKGERIVILEPEVILLSQLFLIYLATLFLVRLVNICSFYKR